MAITYNNLYLDIRRQLRGAGIEAATLEARELVCFGTGKSREQLQRDGGLYASPELERRVRDLVDRHLAGEPVAYLIGEWEFYGLPLDISREVLIPRPDTEVLAEQAINYLRTQGECRVLDLCAGSGCIGISIAKACPGASVYCVEKSTDAFAYLQKNAMPVANVRPVLADISGDLTSLPKPQVLVSNPPYIPAAVMPTLQPEVLKEPMMALDGGTDGLDFYRLITEKIVPTLASGTQLLLEIGDEQGRAVQNLFATCENVQVRQDIYGKDRILIATVA